MQSGPFLAPMPFDGTYPTDETPAKRLSASDLAVALLVLVPLLSLAINALAWFRYGIDLPYADDWRTYRDGTAYSLDLKNLFAPANDTLFPVGKFLDALAMRYLGGNSVAYQFLSMVAVLGGLLVLEWRLLLRVLGDRMLAAASFSLTVFMLQPDSYWGLQNLAYHQALPLLCVFAILLLVTGGWRHSLLSIPVLAVLGLVSGLTYISGAFAILALSLVLLAFALFSPVERRSHGMAGAVLFVVGSACTAAQVWVIVSAQHGRISAKVPWALPYEADFWAYLLGKFGRALLLPANHPAISLTITGAVLLLTAALAAGFLLRLVRRRLQAPRDIRIALVFLSLLAVVFVYMLLVAAGRTNLRPDEMTGFLDIFAFGSLRFHFFWATVLWPFLCAAILLRLGRGQSTRLALGAAFLVPVLGLPTAAFLGAFDHAATYEAKMAYRMENEVRCLEAELQKGNGIRCPVMAGPGRDLGEAYDFARRHDATFTRYFTDLRSTADTIPRPLEEGPVLAAQWPVGEIVAGLSIVQRVPLDADERRSLASGGTICLHLLLATYDRPNAGQATVSLSVGNATRQFDLPFASVEDNQPRAFCGALEAQPASSGPASNDAVIRIDGVTGAPGGSVTAWLTKDASRGTALVNGADTGGSLVFTLAPLDEYRLGGAYSLLAYGLGTGLLALCFRRVAQGRRREGTA